jgi:hypothetical protein
VLAAPPQRLLHLRHRRADRRRRMSPWSRERGPGRENPGAGELARPDAVANPSDQGPEVARGYHRGDARVKVRAQDFLDVLPKRRGERGIPGRPGREVPAQEVYVGVDEAGQHRLAGGVDPPCLRSLDRAFRHGQDPVAADHHGSPLHHPPVADYHTAVLHYQSRLLRPQGEGEQGQSGSEQARARGHYVLTHSRVEGLTLTTGPVEGLGVASRPLHHRLCLTPSKSRSFSRIALRPAAPARA